MRLAFIAPTPLDGTRPPLRQRATSLVLAIGVTLLLIIGLMTLNGSAPDRPRFKGTTLLDFKPDADTTDTTPKQATKPEQQEEQVQPQTPPPRPIPPPPPPQLPLVHPYYIPLTPQENEQADISKMPHAGPRSAGTQQAAGGAPGDSKPIGTAPNGEPLYRAEWYREPTNAELDFYLPHNKQIHGSGIIACKTIDRHHVDDCVELGSFPAGSHLAAAVRQAAWQFLVRAPRRGGRELVGSWVSIEIDYDVRVKGEEKPEDAPQPARDPTYIPY